MDGLCLILSLKYANHYMHIPTFWMPTIKRIWQLYSVWQLISGMITCIFLLLTIIVAVYIVFGKTDMCTVLLVA